MARRAIGLDIGNSGIKLAEVSRRRGGVFLERLGLRPLPPSLLSEEGIMAPDVFKRALQQLLPSLPVSHMPVAIGLGAIELIVRPVELPQMPRGEQREAIGWELQEAVQGVESPNDLVYDYATVGAIVPAEGEEAAEQPAPRRGSPGPRTFVAAAARRRLVDEVVRICREVQLLPGVVEPVTFALPRVVKEPGRACYLDLGVERTVVYVAEGETYRLYRALPMGGRSQTQAFADALKLSFEDAELRKQEYDVAAMLVLTDPAAERLVHHYEGLAEGVTQTLQFVRARERLSDVTEVAERLYLAGGGGAQPGLAEWLSESIGIPAEVLNPLDAVPLAARSDLGKGIEEPHRYASAIGLAIRGVQEL